MESSRSRNVGSLSRRGVQANHTHSSVALSGAWVAVRIFNLITSALDSAAQCRGSLLWCPPSRLEFADLEDTSQVNGLQCSGILRSFTRSLDLIDLVTVTPRDFESALASTP